MSMRGRWIAPPVGRSRNASSCTRMQSCMVSRCATSSLLMISIHALHRHVADDGGALHAAALRIVVVGGVMLRADIVPEHDRVRLPAQAELVFRHTRLLKQ